MPQRALFQRTQITIGRRRKQHGIDPLAHDCLRHRVEPFYSSIFPLHGEPDLFESPRAIVADDRPSLQLTHGDMKVTPQFRPHRQKEDGFMPLLLQGLYDDMVKFEFKPAIGFHRFQYCNSHDNLRPPTSMRSHWRHSPMRSQCSFITAELPILYSVSPWKISPSRMAGMSSAAI